MAIETLDQLKAECPAPILKAFADEVLAQFDNYLDAMMAQVKAEAAPVPDVKPADLVAGVKEADTTELDALTEQLASVQLDLRQSEAREIVQAALAEATITEAGKTLLSRRFADHAPEDKAVFAKEVAEETLEMAKLEKAIAESVRLPGTPGVLNEAGDPEKVDVRAVIASITE